MSLPAVARVNPEMAGEVIGCRSMHIIMSNRCIEIRASRRVVRIGFGSLNIPSQLNIAESVDFIYSPAHELFYLDPPVEGHDFFCGTGIADHFSYPSTAV